MLGLDLRRLVGAALVVTATTALACNGGGGDGSDDALLCEGGTIASSDAYLPFEVGNVWRYRVTEAATGLVSVKRQELTEETTPPDEPAPVIVQVTTKGNGTTESWLRFDGDALVRVRQQDFDATGALEQTTVYTPPKLRLDESADRLADGATFQDSYNRVVTDAMGLEISNIDIVDEWTVLGVDVACESPVGQTECIHIARRRLQGGISDKEFLFARGYGKIREDGGQLEELVECSLE